MINITSSASKITIIHPSRSRPEMAFAAFNMWVDKAGYKDAEHLQYILSLDVSDPMFKNYHDLFNGAQQKCPNFCLVQSDNTNAIEAVNRPMNLQVAKMNPDTGLAVLDDNKEPVKEDFVQGDIIVVVSDDFECPNGWDNFLRTRLIGKHDYVAKVLDGLQAWLITIPILDKLYFKRFGYIYNPLYRHMFCDTEMTAVGDMLGRIVDLKDTNFVFRHRHYTTGAERRDDINVKNDATWEHGKKIFYERLDKNFDLPAEQIVSLQCKETVFRVR